MADKLDKQIKQLAAMAYGEASAIDDENEIYAIASVLVRQSKARGYADISTFALKERTFSFVVNDGNARYKKLISATDDEIAKSRGMSIAVQAAENAIEGGLDKSDGAYFWDGADIKSNYKKHFKVRQGIRFSEVTHNIYDIDESTKLVVIYKNNKFRNKETGEIRIEKIEIGRYDHQYVSTAAYGGTIFWKFNPEYLTVTRAKAYK